MQTFAVHLKEKLQDEPFRKLYEEERQLAELSLQLVVARDKSGRSQRVRLARESSRPAPEIPVDSSWRRCRM